MAFHLTVTYAVSAITLLPIAYAYYWNIDTVMAVFFHTKSSYHESWVMLRFFLMIGDS